MPVRKQQKPANDQKAEDHREQLCAGQKRDRVTNQSDQGKGPHSAKRIGAPDRFVLFSIQPDQEGQEQYQKNLYAFERQPSVEFHETRSPASRSKTTGLAQVCKARKIESRSSNRDESNRNHRIERLRVLHFLPATNAGKIGELLAFVPAASRDTPSCPQQTDDIIGTTAPDRVGPTEDLPCVCS